MDKKSPELIQWELALEVVLIDLRINISVIGTCNLLKAINLKASVQGFGKGIYNILIKNNIIEAPESTLFDPEKTVEDTQGQESLAAAAQQALGGTWTLTPQITEQDFIHKLRQARANLPHNQQQSGKITPPPQPALEQTIRDDDPDIAAAAAEALNMAAEAAKSPQKGTTLPLLKHPTVKIRKDNFSR